MSGSLQSVYDKCPPAVQNLLLSSYSFYINYQRYGGKFETRYEEFLSNQWLSAEELLEYQNIRLRSIIKHAYNNVPYYHDLMEEKYLKPEDISSIEDLHKLPILTRENIKQNMNRLVAKNLSKFEKIQLAKGHTSGTTGSPLEFYWDRNTCVVNNAADWRQKNWAGIGIHEPCAVILGRTIVPMTQKRPPFWRINSIHNTLWFSAFHMTSENLPLYVEQIRKFNPRYIEGYPSTLYILAKFLDSINDSIPLGAAFTSSETLHPIQRETIEHAFKTKLYDFYGLAERVVFATECDAHEGHHLNSDYGITEIVNEEGEPVKPGNIGWIVATGFHNYAMPLIRYKTNDITAIKTTDCSCGRKFPLMEDVTTKAEDIITTKDGKFISSSVLTHPFKPLINIIESQLIQEDLENLIIKIVKGPQYNDNDTVLLLSEMQKRIGKTMKIHVEFVNGIERSANGKFRWVISKVPLKIN